jgi:hypothetical protein
MYENDPNKPPLSTYTLQLVDNTRELKQAIDNLRRVNVQFSAKYIGNDQLRAGIYDLLQKVRVKGKIITSNLPSENFSLGIGSKRLAGTGRTAGIKAKKLEQQGVAESADQARSYLVGEGSRQSGDADLMFLKNAMGQEVMFSVERGGGARAQLLATRKRRRRKLMEAAASRVGASLPVYLRLQETLKRKAEEEKENTDDKQKKKAKIFQTLEFLQDNIGRNGGSDDMEESNNGLSGLTEAADNDDDSFESDQEAEPELVLSDGADELWKLSEENRQAAFQAQYNKEVQRQIQILGLSEIESPRRAGSEDDDTRSVIWEDGDLYQ